MADPVTFLILTLWQSVAGTFMACLTPVNNLLQESVTSCLLLSSNQSSLKNSLRKLQAKAEKLKASVEEEETQLRICNPDIRGWLEMVEDIVNRAKTLFNDDKPRGIDSQHGTCTCCIGRFRIGRQVFLVLQDVNGLLTEGALFAPPFTSLPPSEAGLFLPIMPTFGIDAVMNQVWSQFNDKHTSVIGLYGLAGVGKTTILKRFNNELRERKDEYQFQVVIMLEVANIKTLNVMEMQRTISKQLGVPWKDEPDADRATFLLRALTKKKFVVLLDDVWNKFELKHVGIPTPLPEGYGSKLIVVSRRDSICANMGVKRPIEIHCLQKNESQELFLSKLTENVKAKVLIDNEMKICASEILKSCDGLPLAINAIGSALATSDVLGTWYRAVAAIKQNPLNIDGVDQMLTVLKYSYDMLEDAEKQCFLYCTIFPDYGSIHHEQLLDYWVAEGFISPEPYEGYPIIQKLLSAGLLQRSDTHPASEVKMHQMIRIMGRQQEFAENKLLIKAGQALQQAPDAYEWEEATRISLMSNDIKELSISPNCRKLFTLLLQNNRNLHVDPKFFRFMSALKVLDLSHTAISIFPDCSRLVQLVYLNLSHTSIKVVPKKVSVLLELQYLNMSHTLITELPQQLGKLQKLTHLDLRETSALTIIPHGTISKLFKLKVLNLYKSNYGVKDLPDLNLEGLGKLTYLGITIYSQQVFCKLIKSNPLTRCTRLLSLSRCPGMKSIQLSEFEMMSLLMELHIESCNDLEELIINCDYSADSAKRVSLKVFTLVSLPNLVKVSAGRVTHRFEQLHDLTIHNCPKLENASWVWLFEYLERLIITDCYGVKQLGAPPRPPPELPERVRPRPDPKSEPPKQEWRPQPADPKPYPPPADPKPRPPLVDPKPRPPPADPKPDPRPRPPPADLKQPPADPKPDPRPRPPPADLKQPPADLKPDPRPRPPPADPKPDPRPRPSPADPKPEPRPPRPQPPPADPKPDPRPRPPPAEPRPEPPLTMQMAPPLFLTRTFDYLESITLDNCPNLTELPRRETCPNLKQICGDGSWWETIEPKVKADLGDIFIPI